MSLRLLLGGLKSYVPFRFSGYTGTGGTTSGAYCYAVWMRHVSIIARHVNAFRPRIVVEFGPGDSVGLGLMALLCGAKIYHGLDVLDHAHLATNERVLCELVALLRQRAPIPDDAQFPQLFPRLEAYAIPEEILGDPALNDRLTDESVMTLRAALRSPHGDSSPIRYSCPWSANSVALGSADLVISQVALQDMDHGPDTDDLQDNLETMAGWLMPGGVMSHQIDFACPGGTPWNHHWAYGSALWTLIRGKRPYYVNRVPLSEYIRLINATGCEVVHVEPVHGEGLPRDRLAPPFRQLPESDLRTRAALVVAVKR